MYPPHLPPPACSLSAHERRERLKILLLGAALGLVAGISGAAIMLGWIWVPFDGANAWSVNVAHLGDTRSPLDSRFTDETASRVVYVYRDASSLTPATFAKSDSLAGTALLVSSDGWAVLYQPRFTGGIKTWRGIRKNGEVFAVEKALPDPATGLLYLKLAAVEKNSNDSSSPAPFPVSSFPERLAPGTILAVGQDNQWLATTVSYSRLSPTASSHSDSLPIERWTLDRTFMPGSPVVTAQGRLAGFIESDGSLLPFDAIQEVIGGLLSAEKIVYPTLGVEGWFSDEQPIINGTLRIDGFAVSKVLAGNQRLRRGDVLTTVNGLIVSFPNLWYATTRGSEVTLTVLRNKQNFTITLPVLVLKDGKAVKR